MIKLDPVGWFSEYDDSANTESKINKYEENEGLIDQSDFDLERVSSESNSCE